MRLVLSLVVVVALVGCTEAPPEAPAPVVTAVEAPPPRPPHVFRFQAPAYKAMSACMRADLGCVQLDRTHARRHDPNEFARWGGGHGSGAAWTALRLCANAQRSAHQKRMAVEEVKIANRIAGVGTDDSLSTVIESIEDHLCPIVIGELDNAGVDWEPIDQAWRIAQSDTCFEACMRVEAPDAERCVDRVIEGVVDDAVAVRTMEYMAGVGERPLVSMHRANEVRVAVDACWDDFLRRAAANGLDVQGREIPDGCRRKCASLGAAPASTPARARPPALPPAPTQHRAQEQTGDKGCGAPPEFVDERDEPELPSVELPRRGNTAAARRLNVQGLRARKRGNNREATRLYTRALKADPAHEWARYNLACEMALLGKGHEAVHHLAVLRRMDTREARKALAHTRTDADFRPIRHRDDFAAVTRGR